MKEKNKTWLYAAVIIVLFLVVAAIAGCLNYAHQPGNGFYYVPGVAALLLAGVAGYLFYKKVK